MSARATSPPAGVNVDAYVLDTLMRDLIGHDHASSAFVVYLLLWRQSLGAGEPSVRVSLRDIAEATGLSKRGVQQALSILGRRQLVSVTRRTITDVPRYTVHRPWLGRGHRTR
jgi:DNA-binding GntR family transcriptional regulator